MPETIAEAILRLLVSNHLRKTFFVSELEWFWLIVLKRSATTGIRIYIAALFSYQVGFSYYSSTIIVINSLIPITIKFYDNISLI